MYIQSGFKHNPNLDNHFIEFCHLFFFIYGQNLQEPNKSSTLAVLQNDHCNYVYTAIELARVYRTWVIEYAE